MKKEKKKYTEKELRLALNEARKAGRMEGRLHARESEERRKKIHTFCEKIENDLKQEIERVRISMNRMGNLWSEEKITFNAAVGLVYKTKMRLGERP